MSVIDINNMKVSNPDIHVGIGPGDMAFGNIYMGKVYVVNRGSEDVSVINNTNNIQIKRIPVGAFPQAIEFIWPDKVYVTNRDTHTVSIVNTTSDVKRCKKIRSSTS